jgi:large subunit ribosomal protein L18
MYAQVIDDEEGRTVACASTTERELREQIPYGGNQAAAALVGKAIAERALTAGVNRVAFDRREYKYHGRVAALADAARDAGLDLGAKKAVPEPKKADKGKKKKSKTKSQSKKS